MSGFHTPPEVIIYFLFNLNLGLAMMLSWTDDPQFIDLFRRKVGRKSTPIQILHIIAAGTAILPLMIYGIVIAQIKGWTAK